MIQIVLVFAVTVWMEGSWIAQRMSAANPIPMPMLDIGFFISAGTVWFLEAAYFIFAFCTLIPRFRLWAGFSAAAFGALVLVADETDHFQFHCLGPWLFLALGVSELLRRNGRREDLPFVILLGCVYAFASFHKLFNFSAMQTDLPHFAFAQMKGVFAVICADAGCGPLKLLTWIVVPVEASLAYLTFSGRLRSRLIMVSAFHWFVAFVTGLIVVSFSMLAAHLFLAHLQTRRDVIRNRNWRAFVGTEILLVIGRLVAMHGDSSFAHIAARLFFVAVPLFPVSFLIWPLLRSPVRVPAIWPASFPSGVADYALYAFAALNLLFGFSPLLLEDAYSIREAGWQMYSGGNRAGYGDHYFMQIPKANCAYLPPAPDFISVAEQEGNLIFGSRRLAHLNNWRRGLHPLCNGTP